MKGRLAEFMLTHLALSGSMPDFEPKKSMITKINRGANIAYTPPRSMTEEEKEYYAKHKNLNGFKPQN